jgi:hypothetical protein
MDQHTMGTFDDSNSSDPPYSIFGGLPFPPTSPLSTLAAAQYRPTPSAAFPDPAAAAPGPLAIPPALPPAPTLPPNVTAGTAYGPTRNMWRDRAENRFDLQGKAVP